MPTAPTPRPQDARQKNVREQLDTLRDNPVGNEGCSDAVLVLIYDYLMDATGKTADSYPHWFCQRAPSLTVDAATFLLRLRAYDSPQVAVWTERLKQCLLGCSECAKGLEDAKLSSKATYFGAFPDDIVENFFRDLDKWQTSIILEVFSPPKNLSTTDPLISLDASDAATYQIVANLNILQDQSIRDLLSSNPPKHRFSTWPMDPPPVGLLVLLLSDKVGLREWAAQCLAPRMKAPIAVVQFGPPYRTALGLVASALDTISPSQSSSPFFTTDQAELWKGFQTFLHYVPSEAMLSFGNPSVDLRRVVVGHLHDSGPQFIFILQSFLLLIKRLGHDMWRGEGPEYPQIVFDAIKDNDTFLELLSSTDRPPWLLSYFSEFLHAVREVPSYGGVLARVADFMCEELQHERFHDSRPAILTSAIKLLTSAFSEQDVGEKSKSGIAAPKHRDTVLNILDIHSDAIIAVSFDRAYTDEKWKDARTASRELVKSLLKRDIQTLKETIMMLFHGAKSPPSYPNLRKQYWEKVYACLQTSDHQGNALLIEVAALSAHLYPLYNIAFDRYWTEKKTRTPTPDDRLALERVNSHLEFIHSGLLEVVTKYTNVHFSNDVRNLLRLTAEIVPNIALMMLSPVTKVSQTAQSLISAAFDVDGRRDCFRALLSNFYAPTTKGILQFLRTFNKYANSVPDACDLATSLVRCFTDIVEVLCTSPDGLLHDRNLFKAGSGREAAVDLLDLWSSMIAANCLIFSHARTWATFYESENMVEWMRDAIIFGRDLLSHRGVIEAAIIFARDPSDQPAKPNRTLEIRKKMINDLQEFLPQLAKWLRLTDEELLYQSFSLIESVLVSFRDYGIRPSDDALAKLSKVTTDGRRSDRMVTRLDTNRLVRLEAALEFFDDDNATVSTKATPVISKLEALASKASASSQDSTQSATKKSTPVPKDVSTIQATKASTKSQGGANRKLSAPQLSRHHKQDDIGDASIPSFRRKSAPYTALTRASVDQASRRRLPTEPKNEGAITRKETEETSSDEPGSDEETPNQGLAALSQLQRSPQIKKPTERRGIKLIDVPGMDKKRTQTAAANKEYRRKWEGRMHPNIAGLHKIILSWNYGDNSFEPPRSTQPVHVPDHFNDYAHYLRVFEPLLLMECWAQITRSKEEMSESYECEILNRTYTDDWLDIDLLIRESVSSQWNLTETDIVLLRGPSDGRSTLARALPIKKADQLGHNVKLRCYFADIKTQDPGLNIKTIWRITKVFSLSTINREYAALMALPFYDHCELILRPRLPKLVVPNEKEVERTMASYHVNKPQASAILASLKTPGLSLIQGPPGTGKTATICGLIRLYLSQRPQRIVAPATNRQTDQIQVVTQKILLCAPSNAAIDEVARRVRDSFQGTEYKVVRIGAEAAISNATKDISLDSLVDEALGEEGAAAKETVRKLNALKGQIESIKKQRQEKEEEISSVLNNSVRLLALEEEITKLNDERRSVSSECDRLRDQIKSQSRNSDTSRRNARKRILDEAHVICATLSGAGHESLEGSDFGVVIIDEAAQAIELSSLIPFRYGFQHCVLVGDSKQLPPTVISQEATRFKYNQSLFVRLQNQNPERVHLLSIQYRMHPEISQLPSSIFYDGRLEDGPSMAEKTERAWHSHPMFGVYRFFDVKQGVEELVGQSQRNKRECQVAVSLYGRLRREFASLDFTVGVVTMYKAQLRELRMQFEQRFGRDISKEVDFNTVDGFQGQEKDVIILSCVRAGPGLQRVGFVADIRRMNVALTRAKSSVFILGNALTLERSDDTWRSVIQNARDRLLLTEVDPSFFTTSSVTRIDVPTKRMPLLKHRIPDDIVTPRQFKSQATHKPPTLDCSESGTVSLLGSDSGGTEGPAGKELDDDQSRPLKQPPMGTQEHNDDPLRKGVKRPAEDDPSQEPNSSIQTHINPSQLPLKPAKPIVPPVKRQKPGNGSLFISSQFRKNNNALQSVNKPKAP